ncbi:MAG: response regulator [Chloroflexi bacterium]|nr:response regulator [Chloroflexota bacterium]
MVDKTILLVEDNPDDQFLTLRALRKNQITSEVVIASDAIEALDYLFSLGEQAGRGSASPHLILLDLKLPKMDGLELLKRIRSDERTRSLPVVVLTSSVEERDILAAYRLGVNSYIRKPVEFCEFADAVKQLGTYWLMLNVAPGKGAAA